MLLNFPPKPQIFFRNRYSEKKINECHSAIGIHFFDLLTDLLILTKYIALAVFENDETNVTIHGINYIGVSIVAIFLLLFYRVISTYYVYKYTLSFNKALLQFIEINIIFEIVDCIHLNDKSLNNFIFYKYKIKNKK